MRTASCLAARAALQLQACAQAAVELSRADIGRKVLQDLSRDLLLAEWVGHRREVARTGKHFGQIALALPWQHTPQLGKDVENLELVIIDMFMRGPACDRDDHLVF